MGSLFSFPNPLNEKAARVVAGVVLSVAILTLATGSYWLLVPLAYGFVARVLTGPKLSPLGRFASRHVAPRLGPARLVPGAPKRFAQGMGAALASAAAIFALVLHRHSIADGLLVAIAIAAALESIFAYCLGCKVFALLMRAGLVPEAVCVECSDIWRSASSSRS